MRSFYALKNQKGFNLLEMIIAMVIGILVMGVVILAFTKQQTLFKNQKDSTVVRETARFAALELTKDLRMIGYGVPSTCVDSTANIGAITLADVGHVTYYANTDDVGSTTTANLVATNTAITVNSAAGFVNGGTIAIFSSMTTPVVCEIKTIKSASGVVGNVINITTGLANAYTTANSTVVNSVHTVDILYNAANTKFTKSIDGAAKDTEHVATMTLTYNNLTSATLSPLPLSAANRSIVRNIVVGLTLTDPKNPSVATTTDNTQINLRNLD
jgi:prepilin-type N-terminal cleavage/methylation domain-containing protein